MQSSVVMCLPVEQLHSQAQSPFAKFRQGGGTSYIEEVIDLDREALQLSPPGHPKRSVSLRYLALHLRGRYNQFGAMSDLQGPSSLTAKHLTSSHKDTLNDQCC